MKCLALIGNHSNPYVIDYMRGGKMSVFDQILIPQKFLPDIKMKNVNIQPIETNEEFVKSGFKYESSFYMFMILLVQFII